MKTLFTLLSLALLFLVNVLHAQPTIEWQRCLGGTLSDEGSSIEQTTDGGYIVTGFTVSNDGNVSGFHGGNYSDVWVVKLSSEGIIQWQKCLGGTSDDKGQSIQQTTDGGYIIAGTTFSNDGDVSGKHGIYDVWTIKLNSAGDIQWQKCLGGTGWDDAFSIQQTTDGGYILTGYTISNDGDVSGNHGTGDSPDAWVVKLGSAGDIQWQKCLGGSDNDIGFYIQQTSDGGYIMTGETYSNDGDVSGFHGGNQNDVWVVKLSSAGDVQWQKCLGGTKGDGGYAIQQTTEGGYILTGYVYSNDGDVSGLHGTLNPDVWVVKLNSAGDVQWQKCLGGQSNDVGNSIQQTTDGGYIVGGRTPSNDGDVSGLHGTNNSNDAWIVKLSSAGNIEWQKCLGGSVYENSCSIQQTTDGGYVFAGGAESNDGDVSGVHGNQGWVDFWVVKLGPVITETGVYFTNSSNIHISPNPAKGSLSLKTEASYVGKTYQIFNAQGKTILSGQISAEEMLLSTEGLPAGIYTILAAGQTARLVKE